MALKPLPAIIVFRELMPLDHRAHRAVNNQNTFLKMLMESMLLLVRLCHDTLLRQTPCCYAISRKTLARFFPERLDSYNALSALATS